MTSAQWARWVDLHPEANAAAQVKAHADADARRRAETPEERAASNAARNEYARATYDPARRSAKHLRLRYGMTLDEFNALLVAQGGVCAICGTDYPGPRGWHLDHDHGSGRRRGILCWRCNVGLANLGDDPARMRAAADYVERAR